MKYAVFAVCALMLAMVLPSQVFAHADHGVLDSAAISDILKQEVITDQEYEQIGEWAMEKMMGDDHEEHDAWMAEQMGEEFLDGMHIAMGKQFAEGGSFGMMPMMYMMNPSTMGHHMADQFPQTNSGWGYGMNGHMSWNNPLSVIFWMLLWAFAGIGAASVLKWLAGDKKKHTFFSK